MPYTAPMAMPHKIGIGYSEKRGWKKIAVSFPDALYARIRMRAVDEKRSMSEMVARLAEMGMKRPKADDLLGTPYDPFGPGAVKDDIR
jgi:CopG-like RHH_1 or ribbon-helix-helix domain, RHH_5